MSCTPRRTTASLSAQLKSKPRFALLLLAFVSVRVAAQVVTLTPTSLSFPSQVFETTSASQTVTLKNTGKATLNITSMTASGGFATTTCPSTIAVGGSCQFSVTFTPNALGTTDGAVTIVDNATPGTQVVSLTGIGMAPITFSPTSLSFPATAIGTTSAPKSVTLTNNSPSLFTLSNIATSGDYNISSNGCGVVAAGGNCTIAVTFSPTAKGTIPGALTIGDNVTFEPHIVGLSGSGTGTVTNTISLQPSKLTFANQAINTVSAGQTVTLKNTGKTALTIGTVSTSGNYFEHDTCAGQTINPQSTCTITVQFAPSGYGTVAGAITISDSAATTPQVVGMSGTSTGSFFFSPSALNFFLQTLNLPSAPLTATLTNDSGADIQITGVAVSGDYTQTNNCGSVLAANTSCTFTVAYVPGAAGTTDGAITVTAPNSVFQVLNLSGKGINPTRYAYSIIGSSAEAFAADPSTGFLRFTAQQTLSDICGNYNTATVAPSSNFFYVPGFPCQSGALEGVFGYSIAANGQLAPIAGSPFNLGAADPYQPYQLTITPNGKFAYFTVIGNNVATQIIPASVNTKTGALTLLSGTITYQGASIIPIAAIDPASKFLFLTDPQLGGIYVYTINATTGALTLVTGSPFAVSGTAALAVHPSGKFLISLSGSGPNVLKINTQTGALTLVTGSPFSAPGSSSLALDPSGNFVYVGDSGSSGILTVFRMNATTGALTQVPGSPFANGGLYNQGLSADPSGHYLYLTTALPGGGLAMLQTLSVNEQTGTLTPVTTTGFAPFNASYIAGFATGAKPVSFSDTFAYVANSPVTGISTQNGILQYSISPSTGMLTQVGSLAVSNGPQVLALHPSQQELYSSEAGGVLLGYSIGAGGVLNTNALGQGEPTVFPMYSIASDPAGAWLLATDADPGSGGSEAALWQINADQTLGSLPFGTFSFSGPGVAVTTSPAAYGPVAISSDGFWWGLYDPSNTGAMWGAGATGASPAAIAYDGAGRFVYVANSADNTISGFTSDGNNLVALNSGVPYATGTTPSAIAGDPWGRYLYVANAGSQNVWEYSIDPLSGNLTPLSASPLALGVSPNSLTMDYAGNFLYATNSAAGTVSVMSLNSDGSLTLQGTTTVNSGATQSPAPTSMVVTGTAK